MKRRTFIHILSASGLSTFLSPGFASTKIERYANDSLAGSFRNPPFGSGAYTWWHWMNGNVTKEGITLDLEAMKEAGVAGFQLFEAGTGIPQGEVESLSDRWLELLEHAMNEAGRLQLEFAMHNCPGWSSSGGPWITPELSMQEIVWSETIVTGGKKIKIELPRPGALFDFYRDARIVAFPLPPGESDLFGSKLQDIRLSHGEADVSVFKKGKTLDLFAGATGEAGYIEFVFSEPLPIGSVLLQTSGESGEPLGLEIVSGATGYREIARIPVHGGMDNRSPHDLFTYVNPERVETSRVRITFKGKRHFSSIRFHSSALHPGWMSKANFRNTFDHAAPAVPEKSLYTVSSADVIDLTRYMQDGNTLVWDAPAGDWAIIRLGHTAVGQLNHSAPTRSTGLECDKLSKKALTFHFEQMFGKLKPQMERLGRTTRFGLLIDSYEMGNQNWTEELPAEFEARRGYNIIPYIPALTGRVVDSPEATERFLWDFRRTHADVMADNYYGHFTELCKASGLITYTEPYGSSLFEEQQVGKKIDINMGEFWIGLTLLWPNILYRRTLKMVSSIARSTGSKVVGAEAFTAEPTSGKWQQYPYSLKSDGDWMYTKGLNRFYFHRYAHQPHPTAMPGMTMGPWGTHFDRTNTWWKPGKAWLEYIRRCQFLLQQGDFVADLLYYTDESSWGQSNIAEDSPILPPPGYDYDLINRGDLENISVEGTRITLTHGRQYRVFVLPYSRNVSVSTLEKLVSLVQKGMWLVGERPVHSLGLKDLEKADRFDRLTNELWGAPDHPENERQVGKGRVFVTRDLRHVLDELKLKPDFFFTALRPDAPVNYIHRKWQDADIYFIANRRRSPEQLVATFRVGRKRPELWHPDTGKTVPVACYECDGDTTTLPLTLDPAGSVFVVFRETAEANPVRQIAKEGVTLLEANPYTSEMLRPAAAGKENFTLTLWVKPETDIATDESQMIVPFKTDRYAIFPVEPEREGGQPYSTLGLTAGRNGFVLFERTEEDIFVRMICRTPVAGWTHVAVRTENNTPSLFINGRFLQKGEPFVHPVWPGPAPAYQLEGASYYDGEIEQLTVSDTLLDQAALRSVVRKGVPQPASPSPVQADPETPGWLFYEKGAYQVTRQDGKSEKIVVRDLPQPLRLEGPWNVRFPEGYGAPEQITLSALVSFHKHEDEGVRYFSGTATYSHSFEIGGKEKAKGLRYLLDLGRVEVIAVIKVNGRTAGCVWKPPYRKDITPFLKEGSNRIEIEVTNLWPNRLIGDERLPAENEYEEASFPGKFSVLAAGGIKKLPEWYRNGLPKPAGGRITFATWKHYQKDSPLQEAGLLGPVVIYPAKKVELG